MRIVLAALITLCIWSTASLQTLRDVYSSGTVILSPDAQYGSNADWDELFADYFKKRQGNAVGARRSLVVADDGSAFVGNYAGYSVYKFAPDGAFLIEFGEKGSEPGRFRSKPNLQGIVDDKLIIVSEYNGRISFFDLNGEFRKSVQLDYMPLSCVGLRDGKYAVAGHVPYGGGDVKYIVAIRDAETDDEQIVSSVTLKQKDRVAVQFDTDEGCIIVQNPLSGVDVFVGRTTEGNLVVGYSNSPEISVYSPEGERLIGFELDIDPIAITDEVKSEYYEGIRESVPKKELQEEALSVISQPGFFPDHMPYYYYMLVDSENNLLVFIYSADDATYRFRVYSLRAGGTFICETEAISEDFELTLDNRFHEVRFHDDWLYGILVLKQISGIPLRLTRMSLSSGAE